MAVERMKMSRQSSCCRVIESEPGLCINAGGGEVMAIWGVDGKL